MMKQFQKKLQFQISLIQIYAVSKRSFLNKIVLSLFFGSRHGVNFFDLKKTLPFTKRALSFLKKATVNFLHNSTILESLQSVQLNWSLMRLSITLLSLALFFKLFKENYVSKNIIEITKKINETYYSFVLKILPTLVFLSFLSFLCILANIYLQFSFVTIHEEVIILKSTSFPCFCIMSVIPFAFLLMFVFYLFFTSIKNNYLRYSFFFISIIGIMILASIQDVREHLTSISILTSLIGNPGEYVIKISSLVNTMLTVFLAFILSFFRFFFFLGQKKVSLFSDSVNITKMNELGKYTKIIYVPKEKTEVQNYINNIELIFSKLILSTIHKIINVLKYDSQSFKKIKKSMVIKLEKVNENLSDTLYICLKCSSNEKTQKIKKIELFLLEIEKDFDSLKAGGIANPNIKGLHAKRMKLLREQEVLLNAEINIQDQMIEYMENKIENTMRLLESQGFTRQQISQLLDESKKKKQLKKHEK